MFIDLKVGLKGRAENVVYEANTAKSMRSGSLDVFATPALVALMEAAAVNALQFEAGESSVGTALEIIHSAATPIGMKVWAEAVLVEVDRRRLVFEIDAYDEVEKIGSGRHERFIIQEDRFLSKANQKSGNLKNQ
ncbi:thioesterase family protein [Desulfitobacterium metallireducens]|uniref:thioesterase family protein n=1 Tax=Desulfitobacterium metallireducens TaxID=142877 RepID=UPI0002314D96|nr:thioesterase family protein [Desulfitobacterium metallireducens]